MCTATQSLLGQHREPALGRTSDLRHLGARILLPKHPDQVPARNRFRNSSVVTPLPILPQRPTRPRHGSKARWSVDLAA